MTNKIATEQYLINLAGGGTNTPPSVPLEIE
jgi:hypothetical protein